MPNFLKPFKSKGASGNNSADGAILTNTPFYLSPEHLSAHVNAVSSQGSGGGGGGDANPNSQGHGHVSCVNELPLLEQYSDPKDLIVDTLKNSLHVSLDKNNQSVNEEDQNYMVPFSESQSQATATVLHLEDNNRRDSLSERLEQGFNGEVYENIPTSGTELESPEHRRAPSSEVSPSHVEDSSYYETTWGTFANQKNVHPTSEHFQNFNLQYRNGSGRDVYENAHLFSERNNSSSGPESRYSNDVFDDQSSSQLPLNDSRPDAEYDVPWTCANSAGPVPNAQKEEQKEVSRRPVHGEDLNAQKAAVARKRHKSGDFGNKSNLNKSHHSTAMSHQKNSVPPVQEVHQTKTADFRPEDDYDQPWELTAGKRNSAAFRTELSVTSGGNEVTGSSSSKGHMQFTDPTNDMRPEDDYDQPWNLTSKQTVKVGGEGSNDGSNFNLNSKQNAGSSTNVVSQLTSSTSSISDERSLSSSQGGLHRGHQRQSAKSKKTTTAVSSQHSVCTTGAGGELVDANLSLEEQVWYHGQISRVAAEARLRPAPECSYLVRRSESSRHDYSLSIKSACNIMHMKIQYQESTKKYILGQFSKPYISIPAMIAYYSKHTLNIKGAENVTLLRPVPDTADNML